MSEPKPLDPCMSLEIEADGAVLLTVAAQLRPGALNWTAAEAGLWFARSWQRAEQALATVTIHRALEQGQVRLIAQDGHAWSFVAAPAAARPAEAPASPAAANGVERPPTTPVTIPVTAPAASIPDREEDQQVVMTMGDEPEDGHRPAMFNGPEALLTVPAPRISERAGETADQRKIIRHLNKAEQPLSVADLCKQADLTPYRARKALDGLLDKGLIQEEKIPSRGRYKEMAVYSGARPEVEA